MNLSVEQLKSEYPETYSAVLEAGKAIGLSEYFNRVQLVRPISNRQIIDVEDRENKITFHVLPLTGENEYLYLKAVEAHSEDKNNSTEVNKHISELFDKIVRGWTIDGVKSEFKENDKPSEMFGYDYKFRVIYTIHNLQVFRMKPEEKKS